MATGRNGNGRKRDNGKHGDVPRWVRTLFDQHERQMEEHARRMAALDRAHTDHEARMEEMRAEHDAHLARLNLQVDELRRQTREMIKEISHLDAERKAESERNRTEHLAFLVALKDVRKGP